MVVVEGAEPWSQGKRVRKGVLVMTESIHMIVHHKFCERQSRILDFEDMPDARTGQVASYPYLLRVT